MPCVSLRKASRGPPCLNAICNLTRCPELGCGLISQVVRSDVLLVNYTRLSELRGGPLSIAWDLTVHLLLAAFKER